MGTSARCTRGSGTAARLAEIRPSARRAIGRTRWLTRWFGHVRSTHAAREHQRECTRVAPREMSFARRKAELKGTEMLWSQPTTEKMADLLRFIRSEERRVG